MEEILKTPTGIERLDRDTGGFIPGKTYLLSGGAHTAKTVFAVQFLRQGINSDENALLLTDKKPEDFLSVCRDLEMEMDHYLKSGRFVLLKYLFQAEDIIRGEKELSFLLGELENFILANRIGRAAVDTAVPLFRMIHKDWFDKGFGILIRELGKLGITLLLTSRMPATQKALEARNHVEANVSGSIHLDELTKSGGATTRKMTIRKMSHLAPPYPVYEFEIKKGEGISVTSRSSTGLESPRERILSKAKEAGVSFSKEYKEQESPRGKPSAPGWPGALPKKGKGVSFPDKYDIENKKES